MKYWKYLKYVLRHKWFVLLAGIKLGVPLWMLILHDWDKFLPSMWFPYMNYFHGNLPKAKDAHLGALAGLGIFPYTREDCERDFARAWNAHQKRNKHHWQYWMLTWDRGETECLPMPDIYIREMLADWKGAGNALGKPDTVLWYDQNRDKIILHEQSRQILEMYMRGTDE